LARPLCRLARARLSMRAKEQVFWLRGRPTHPRLSAPLGAVATIGAFVARYSGATVRDLHPIPYSPKAVALGTLSRTPQYMVFYSKNYTRCSIFSPLPSRGDFIKNSPSATVSEAFGRRRRSRCGSWRRRFGGPRKRIFPAVGEPVIFGRRGRNEYDQRHPVRQ
jgi:hypothetical protein